jgi:NitT/TauT family transport system permease protein
MFWSPSQTRRTASPLDLLALLVFGLLVLAVFLDTPHAFPGPETRLNLAVRMLPVYAVFSLLRMVGAYVVSLAFAFVAGYFAATSPLARRFILPGLDILQSVPILGFFPAAIFFFIHLFRGSSLGVEAAAVFLIFTSQAWNLAFSVYESLITIPEDISTAVRTSNATGIVRWRRLLLPACVPRLTYNSMLSWAGGWYFLIASEMITVGPRSYTLPGLGSYIGQAIADGTYAPAAAGIGALATIIVLMHILVWSPLEYWSRRFRYEYASRPEAGPPPLALSLIQRAPLLRRTWVRALNAAGRTGGAVTARVSAWLTGAWMRYFLAAIGLAASLAIAYGGVRAAAQLARPLPPEAARIPVALLYSFLRLLVAYVISLAWTIPLAYWLSLSARRSARVLPVVQVLASMPATAFFPVIVAVVLALHLGLNVASVALVLTGMQWYLLFNVVAGAQAMPEDLRELAAASDVHRWLYLRRFFLPVAAPSLITGSLTGWGGGWNALIISEYLTVKGRTYSVEGIGSLLDRATYVQGDLQMITLTIVSMVVVISLVNRFVWRRLYQRATERYRLEY